MSRVTLIVAATTNNGIGQAGKLPWRLPREMKYFARVTTGRDRVSDGNGEGGTSDLKNAVVMGRATWESIPHRFRPLAGRINIVVSRQKDYNLGAGTGANKDKNNNKEKGDHDAELSSVGVGAVLTSSLESALDHARAKNANRVFVIGGAKLYAEALSIAERVLLTRIVEPEFEGCDVFMPNFIEEEDGEKRWTRAPHEELSDWVGFEVPKEIQEEGGVKYEYELWTKDKR
ncbi:dihydrofolate reductase-like domain-containing protein [Multifurca ochricompacta]|uniref:Dihydrofolate reductase n=1 Tax=Multifurca ochricompacta TaxID=376703 RepID=A0AAD4QIU4_9AGAM|nr:dihydrofolate reductase-like domain-containing protein [Multifurca ochricompacta]